jgi:hypothetical protein
VLARPSHNVSWKKGKPLETEKGSVMENALFRMCSSGGKVCIWADF